MSNQKTDYQQGAISRMNYNSGWWILWHVKNTKLCHATEGPFATKKQAHLAVVAAQHRRATVSLYCDFKLIETKESPPKDLRKRGLT